MSAVSSLTNPVALLERMPVRERGGARTQSAWRIAVTASEGSGFIVRLETAGGEVHFRGEGLFLGWGADEMSAAWDALAHSDAPPEAAFMQLG